MAMESFAEALRVCRLEEGGNDDDPHDHGGRTSRGITQREWDVWRRSHVSFGPLPADVWQAPESQIDAIYHDQYWQPYGDALPAGLDLVFFIFNVNAGRVQAVRELQRALGVDVDGMLGIATRDAIAAAPDIPILIRAYCDRQREFYRQLAQFGRYGRGWLGRVDHAQAAGQKLAGLAHIDLAPRAAAAAARVDAVADRPEITVSAKANPADLAEPVITPEKAVATAGGTGTLAGTLQQLQDQMQGLAGYVKWAQVGLAIVAAVSIGVALYGLWKRKTVREAV